MDPKAVSSRKSKRCWGVKSTSRYDPKIHNLAQEEVIKSDTGVRIRNVFYKYLQQGEEVGVDEVRKRKFTPVWRNQKQMTLEVWVSEGNDIERVHANVPGAWKVCEITIPLGPAGKGVELHMYFVRDFTVCPSSA